MEQPMQARGIARIRNQKFLQRVTIYLVNGKEVRRKAVPAGREEGTIVLVGNGRKDARMVVIDIAQIAAYEMRCD